MKKTLLKYILFFTACMGLSACDALFDNELPEHDLVPENAIIDEKSAEKALLGIYSYLDDSQYNGGYLNSHLITYNYIRLNLMTAVGPSSFENDQLYRFAYDETDANYENGWRHVYRMINAANNVIYYVEQLGDEKFGTNRRNEILAEARFLRAFCYMYLMQHHAQFWDTESKYGLVLRLEPSKLSLNKKARSSVSDSYKAIFDDLEFAVNNAPDYQSSYRICKTSAKAFKANYLMMRGTPADREEDLRLAEEVIASGDFSMEEKYADIFAHKHTSPELLFTQYTDRPGGWNDNVQGLLQLLGAGKYRAKENTPDDDLSKYYTIMDNPASERYTACMDSVILPQGKDKTFIWKKFYNLQKEAVPRYYLRVAQMYLIKAEAMSYRNYTVADVVETLNVLHSRANEELLDAGDYSSMEEVREEIFREYIREVGAENGDPFFYAARTMINGKRLLQEYNMYFEEDNTLCFPIPAKEIEINSLAEQNPY